MSTTIPRRLSHQEKAAVGHLLRYSALSSCVGVPGRIVLDGHDLTIRDLSSWSWSGGERVLLEVLLHILGEARWPDIGKCDDHERQVIREALRFLALDEARLGAVQ
jgi:hypothetical protein